MPISGAVKTERESQIGSVYGSMIKRVCTVAWTLLGMYAIAAYPGLTSKADIDAAFGRIAYDLLPAIAPGLIGIFIAALLASIMSSCDAFMITCSALFTQNIYRPFIAPDRTQSHYVSIGRLAAFFTVVGGVFIAYLLPDVIAGLELTWKISAMMGIAFWAGLFWRRTTSAGAWAGTLASFAVVLFTSRIELAGRAVWDFNARYASALPDWMVYEGAISLPLQMLGYLSAGLIALVLFSLITPRHPDTQLDPFYETLRTPVEPGEVIPEPVRLPVGRSPAPQRKLIDHPDWEFQRPTPRGIWGFIIAWILVVALILTVWGLVRIGA
jgi:Na+/proline symporter